MFKSPVRPCPAWPPRFLTLRLAGHMTPRASVLECGGPPPLWSCYDGPRPPSLTGKPHTVACQAESSHLTGGIPESIFLRLLCFFAANPFFPFLIQLAAPIPVRAPVSDRLCAFARPPVEDGLWLPLIAPWSAPSQSDHRRANGRTHPAAWPACSVPKPQRGGLSQPGATPREQCHPIIQSPERAT